MKKFKLMRMAALGVASTMLVSLSACSLKQSKTIGNKVGDTDKSTEYNYEFVEDAPVALPIEEVALEDGRVGFKMPNYYLPILVDKEKPFPGFVEVVDDSNSMYSIVSGSNVTYPDGTQQYQDFSGAVAVYYPYWQAINYKYNTILGEDSTLSCRLKPVSSDVFGEAYLLPEGFNLYESDVDKQGIAIPYVVLEDGATVVGVSEEDVNTMYGVTDDVLKTLEQIDVWEENAHTVFKQHNNSYFR